MNWIEIIGYVASACVAVSLLMVSLVRLRLINLIGCLVFVAYGAIIGAMPIVITNSFIAVVNCVFLYRTFFRNINAFTYIPVTGDRRAVLDHFISSNLADIRVHFPLFQKSEDASGHHLERRGFIAFRDLSAVGFALLESAELTEKSGSTEEREIIKRGCASVGASNCMYMSVDYIAKPYRDMGVGSKLYNEIVRTLHNERKFLITIAASDQRRHMKYLRSHGFSSTLTYGSYVLFSCKLES